MRKGINGVVQGVGGTDRLWDVLGVDYNYRTVCCVDEGSRAVAVTMYDLMTFPILDMIFNSRVYYATLLEQPHSFPSSFRGNSG